MLHVALDNMMFFLPSHSWVVKLSMLYDERRVVVQCA
jgi:hypothetical protein